MSIMIDLPPAMAEAAQGYARLEGTTLEQMFLKCIADDLKRRSELAQKSSELMDRWRAVVRKGRGRLVLPYKFNRADAYPCGEFA